MEPRKKRKLPLLLVLCIVCVGVPLLYFLGRPLPVAMNTQPFQGVHYYRRVHFTPYPMVAHIVVVDLQAPGIGFLVTPGDPKQTLALTAHTTSQFARAAGVQIAINGDGFTPWWAKNLFDYFPHVGDQVAPNGYAMSDGVAYGPHSGPTIYFSKDGRASFTLGDISVYNAISGNNMIVVNGKAIADLDNSYAAPRTAIGLDDTGKKLILFVADGRQPFYSQGATLYEMAQLMMYYGAANAMNMDGGGSSTLVMQNALGIYQVINSPIQTSIPGRERPVGNQLGIFAERP
ncbi:MAG: phosphodiester glycosidase family protein [Anaerolineales bacterium]